MPKWYVNLPSKTDQRQGNIAVYKVKTTVSDVDQTDAPGREIVWVLESHPDNTELRYLPADKRAKLKSDRSISDAQAWAHNELTLPHVGGDRYTVKVYRAGDDPATARTIDEIVTWRKIFYTTHYVGNAMKNRFRAVKARMIAGFEPAFVELEEVAVLATPEVREDAVCSSNDLRTLYQAHVLGYRPWHVRIVVARNLVDAVSQDVQIVTRHNTNTANCVVARVLDDFRVTITTGHDMLGDDPVSSILAFVQATPHGGGAWQTLGAPVDIKESTRKTGPRTLVVDLKSYSARLYQPLRGYPDEVMLEDPVTKLLVRRRRYDDGRVILALTYNRAGMGAQYNGHSCGNFVCVRGHRPGEGTDDEIERMILGTFVHEIGHGLQQVVRQEQLYDGGGAKIVGSFDRNYIFPFPGGVNAGPWHTDDQGGRGPHCATNGRLDGAGEWELDPGGAGPLCTMYFAGSLDRSNGVFCASCTPRLKRADLSEINMLRQEWDYT